MSLFEMMLQRPAFAHITTSIPTLDSMIPVDSLSSGIFDLQSVPSLNAVYSILCSIIVSHISHDPLTNKVIIIDTLNTFPWKLLSKQSKYESSYQGQIIWHRINRFSNLLQFFIADNGIQSEVAKGSTLIIINDFHDLLELYRLETWSCYKEKLLKSHITRNSSALNNRERLAEDAQFKISDPIPSNSDLLNIHPSTKSDAHIYQMFDSISKFSVHSNLLVFLVGALATKFKKYTLLKQNSHPPSSTINSQLTSSSVYENYGGRMYFLPSQTSATFQTKNGSNTVESLLTSRLIFYKDWFSESRTKFHDSQLKMVFATQVTNFRVIGINEPVYFDYNDKSGDSIFTDLSNHSQTSSHRPLLSTTQSKPTPRANSMTRGDTVVDLKQADSHFPEHITSTPNFRPRQLPSSPNMTSSQRKEFFSSDCDQQTTVGEAGNGTGEADHSSDDLVIEASDNESDQSILLLH